MFGEPAPRVSEDRKRSWQPKGYLAWLEARTLVRGRYELLSYVGSGNVGSVFIARHIGFDETVALKFLQPRYLSSPDAAGHFVQEARAGFKLRSEHIARVYDVDVHQEVPFIATEMLEGETLRARLKRCGAVGSATSVDYALQVCAALACAHALGSLHLDIKPENLFVLGDEQIKLVDFGISQIPAANGSRPAVCYVAPELIRARAAADTRADIWSLGCVLYELLSGRAAFDRGDSLATCTAVLEEEPVTLSTLPDGLWSVISRCLQKAPEARFADTAEVAAALEPFGSGHFSHYPERCRVQLQPELPPNVLLPSAAAVSVQPTMVLGHSVAAEPLSMAQKPSNRKATLAFDASAFASPAEAVRVLEAKNPLENLSFAAEQPLQMRAARASGIVLLMAAFLSMAWGGLALLSGPEKPQESPKLMHLVTPRVNP